MTFQGLTGDIVINAIGDREYDHEIWHYQNGMNIPVLMWSAKEGKIKKLYKPIDPDDWSGLIWAGNVTTVPKDTPACGFKNEFCETNEGAIKTAIGGGVTGGLFLCIMIGTGLAGRYFR